MSLKPELIPEIPDETKRVAKASFPKGNIYAEGLINHGTASACVMKLVSFIRTTNSPRYSPTVVNQLIVRGD